MVECFNTIMINETAILSCVKKLKKLQTTRQLRKSHRVKFHFISLKYRHPGSGLTTMNSKTLTYVIALPVEEYTSQIKKATTDFYGTKYSTRLKFDTCF